MAGSESAQSCRSVNPVFGSMCFERVCDLNPQVSKDAILCERPDNRQVSGSDGVQQDVNVLRAVLTERLQNVGRCWEKIGLSFGPCLAMVDVEAHNLVEGELAVVGT